MSKFCTNCGKEIDPSVKFCTNCGAKNLIYSDSSVESYSNKSTTKDFPFFTIQGRLNRLRYFKYSLILLIGCLILLTTIVLTFTLGSDRQTGQVGFVISIFYIVCQTFLSMRRFHDLNLSGFHCLSLFSVIFSALMIYYNDYNVGSLFFTILFMLDCLCVIMYLSCLILKKGTTGKNKYGDDPLN